MRDLSINPCGTTKTTVVFAASLLFLCVAADLVSGQSHAYVVHYQKQDYGGGNQNWDLAAGPDGTIFGANNAGLLVLGSAQPSLFPLPTRTSIRSVTWFENRIFTGSFEEAGFWERGPEGTYQYTSLLPLAQNVRLQNDEFWKIVVHDNRVYFQSFGHILRYDGIKLASLTLPGNVLFLLKAGNRLFAQKINGSLFELRDSTFFEIPGSGFLAKTEVKAILPDGDHFVVGTSDLGLFTMNEDGFKPFAPEASQQLKTVQLNNGIRFPDGSFAFGTILKGIFLLNPDGSLRARIHTGTGLQNNTVLSLMLDNNHNLWAGLDKGIDCIWINAPVSIYKEEEDPIGAVYTAALQKDLLYAGTNQGLYAFKLQPDGTFASRSILQGSEGQAWFLKQVDGQLYAGLNSGTYRVQSKELRKISEMTGGYNLVESIQNGKRFFLQGTYSNITVYTAIENVLRQQGLLSGFTAPTRFLEIDYLGNILAGHTVKGAFVIQPNVAFDSVSHAKELRESDGLPPGTARLVKVDNRILLPSTSGLLEWQASDQSFKPFTALDAGLGRYSRVRAIIPAGAFKYWFIRDDEAGLFEIRFGKVKQLYGVLPSRYDLKMVEGYESIVALNDSLHLFCLEDGFALLNLYKLNRLPAIKAPPVLSRAVFVNAAGDRFNAKNHSDRIPPAFNTVACSFSNNDGSPLRPFFSHKLEPLETSWSRWSDTHEVMYSRLPPGVYTLYVKTMSAHGLETEAAALRFTIRKPWFLTSTGFFLEGLMLAAFGTGLWILVRRRRWRREEAALIRENERMLLEKEHAVADLLKANNERLRDDMNAKNVELARNTMHMLRKNEALIEIKEELDRLKTEMGYRLPAKRLEGILSRIESNLDGTGDWDQFELLFDQANGDFFKRLKQEFADLTVSDLRLCAYLRMGLSSKEIAPLLNITVRGVEEKRYRLRKRLNLNTEQGLTDFILKY